MNTQAKTLRELLKGEPFIAADCYSALTGRIVERVGFKAAYLGGHACGAFHYAVPDNGVISQVEQIEQAQRIAAAINIPLIVDADTLGETVADAFHFARRYGQAGIAGIHVEDERNPKHGALDNGLIPIIEMQSRLEAAKKGAGDSGLVIIARCDEIYTATIGDGGGGSGSVEEAIKRGNAYLEAGADALVFPLSGPDVQAQLVAALPKNKICSMGPLGVGSICALHTGWGWSGAAQTHLERAKTLFETGSLSVDMGLEGKAQLLEQDVYDALIVDWANKTGRKHRR